MNPAPVNATNRSRLTIIALGAFAIVDEQQVDLRAKLSQNAQLLLLYLLTTGESQPREALAELFWPERSIKQSASNLRTVLTELRRACAPHLVISRQTLAVDRSYVTYDVLDFRRAIAQAAEWQKRNDSASALPHWERAVTLHQRAFLATFRDRASPELQLWLTQERELLYNQMLGALRHLVSYYEQQGNLDAAQPLAQRWLALEPVEPMALSALMRILTAQGDADSALTHYRTFVRIYRQEQGALPLPSEVEELANAIVQGAYQGVAALTVHTAAPSRPTAAADKLYTNLPQSGAPLLGRTEELAALQTLLLAKKERLITIVGLGGQGKTALALAVAATCQGAFADGVWFVPLATLEPAQTTGEAAVNGPLLCEQVAGTIGTALGLTFSGAQPLVDQLLRQVRQRQLCLILDNFEHLVAAAPLLLQLLEGAPQITLLVTTRIRLDLFVERVFLLDGLALPTNATPEAVVSSASGQLFVTHAQRQSPAFAVTAQNAVAIADLCRLTGGLPLALILAATWVDHLAPAAIVAEIDKNLAILAANVIDLPLRQRQLLAVFTTAWEQLTPAEQSAMMQLALLPGSFDRQSAQAVAAVSLLLLRALVDKAQLSLAEQGRYRIHPLLRQFALANLDEHDAAKNPLRPVAEERLATYFFGRLQAITEEKAWPVRLAAFVQEEENFRAALQWYSLHEPQQALLLAVALAPYWEKRGSLTEGRQWLQRLIDAIDIPSLPLSDALYQLAFFMHHQSDLAAAEATAQRARALYQTLNHQRGIAQSCALLGWIEADRFDFGKLTARRWFEEGIAHFTAVGDRQGVANLWRAMIHTCVPPVTPYATMVEYLEKAVALYQEIADVRGMAMTLHGGASVAVWYHRYAEADRYQQRAAILQSDFLEQYPNAWFVYLSGEIAYHLGRHEEAQRCLRAALALFQTMQAALGLGLAHFYLGANQQAQGQWRAARLCYEEALLIFRAMVRSDLQSRTIAHLGEVYIAEGALPKGVLLLATAQAILGEFLPTIHPQEEADYHGAMASARAQLSETAFANAWTEGAALPLDIATAVALRLHP